MVLVRKITLAEALAVHRHALPEARNLQRIHVTGTPIFN